MTRLQLLLLAGAAAGVPAIAAAQCAPGGPPNPAAVPHALVGIVMDSEHTPIEGATVLIREPRRQARTRADGRFQIDSLAPGTYELTVRRIGHQVAIQSYMVYDGGGVARFCLIPEPRGLAPMITSVARGGLGGVVGDTGYKMLSGAEIVAVAGGARTVTDSAGGFFLPLKPGSYAIQVKKEGFGTQLLSVTVPADSGRQIAVWLGAPPRNARRIAAAIEDSMKFRLMTARPNSSRLISSEALMRNPTDLAKTVQASIVVPVSDSCDAVIDGGPFKMPLSVIDKEEIAVMEVYASGPARDRPTSVNPGGARPTAPTLALCPKIYVWLKP